MVKLVEAEVNVKRSVTLRTLILNYYHAILSYINLLQNIVMLVEILADTGAASACTLLVATII